jgi:hypothetical protein
MRDILLRLGDGQPMTQTLVLDHCRVAHPLIFAEHAIGKRVAFPAHFESPIGEVVDLDILAGQLVGQLTPFQDDLPTVIGQAELLAHMALLAVAQDVSQP